MSTKFSGPVVFEDVTLGSAEASLTSAFGWSIVALSTAGGASRILEANEDTAATIAQKLATLIKNLGAKGIISTTDDDEL